ncbi:MAG: Wzz/FepE/Etk N-terminal domain-containing protein [Terriglobia bacterium]|jgi:uncharacterized protein involved in exopolysaccharide biosynthesis
MLGQREMTAEDVTGILRRGWLYILIPFLLCPLLALGVAYLLPAKYTSEALVMIEQQKVPDSVVKSVVQQNLIARVTSMESQVLSRSKLQPMIEKYGLYRSEIARGVGMDDLLTEMRENISVNPLPSVIAPPSGAKVTVVQSSKDEIPGFIVAFTYEKAKLAQEVCTELVGDFVQVNLVEREKMAADTTTFLGTQLQDAKRNLDEEDAKMATFQQKYAGELPDDERNNLSLLQSITARLEAVTTGLQRAQQDKTYAESLLAQQLSFLETMRSGAHPETTDKEIAALEDRLTTMEARYTPDHPDIVKLKATIEELKKSRDVAPAAADSGPAITTKGGGKVPLPAGVDPPDIQKLRSQLRGLEEAVSAYHREQVQLSQEAKSLEAKLRMSPTVEAEYKAVSRDYKTAMDFYNDLLTKRNNSGMATDLERASQGETFTVLDPPSLPDTPSFPVYWMFAAGGAAGGLVIGLAIVLLREMKDKAIRSERDIEFFLELPTLVLLPSVGVIQKRKNGRFRTWWRKRRKVAVKSGAEQPVQA